MDSLSVLAVAYACRPDQGSEAGVGWGWVNAIARNHRVTVITADFNLPAIERYCQEHSGSIAPNLRFVYVRNRAWHYRPQGVWLKIENSHAKPLMNLAYQDWLRCAYQTALEELSESHYDLVHLITFVGWRFPGRFYQLDIPFVWGPIGGLVNTPWRLLPAMGIEGVIYYGGRNIINWLQLRMLGGPRRALRKADSAVIAATSEIQRALSAHFGTSSRVVCEVGLPMCACVQPQVRAADEPLKICWSGLHLPGKALPILLRAAGSLPAEVKCQIHILGDGPSHSEWRTLARRLGIYDRCVWYGHVRRDHALAVMRGSHMFAITSFKELTSTVAIEALAMGLPILCLDHCGFADLVTNECGMKVHPGYIPQMVRDFAMAITRLHQDEAFRFRLARGAIRRSRDYSWEGKLAELDEIYLDAVAQHSTEASEKPEINCAAQADRAAGRAL